MGRPNLEFLVKDFVYERMAKDEKISTPNYSLVWPIFIRILNYVGLARPEKGIILQNNSCIVHERGEHAFNCIDDMSNLFQISVFHR